MITEKHTVRLSAEDWAQLVSLAAHTVRDSEVHEATPATATRVSPLMRMIARGELIVLRPERVEVLSDGNIS